MDSDKILVIEAGHLQEFDSPSNLLADTGSLFYGFAKRAGII
jgi:ABC-type multidrug transport system fused ATPase/permease subunit